MDLQLLKTFVTISKTQSFTKASEILDYAQSSVSGQMKLLEEELGVKLFERLGRKIYLTHEGSILLSYAEQILKLAQEANDVVSSGGYPKGTIIIGAPESISIYRLPVILEEYRKKYPDVQIVLKLGACSDIIKWVKENEVDIAVLMDNQILDFDLVVEQLKGEKMSLVSSVNHHLAQKEKVEITDLEGEQLIFIEKDACYRCIFEEEIDEQGITPSSTLEIGSIETIKKCVISGLGISLLPKMSVEQEMQLGKLVELSYCGLKEDIFIFLIYHKDKWISPTIKAFIKITTDHLR